MARIADRSQQDCPGSGAGGPGLVGESGPRSVPGRSREVVVLDEEAVAEAFGHPFQHAFGFSHHVGADAVPGQTDYGQIHGGRGW